MENKNEEKLPLFLNRHTVAKLLGVSLASFDRIRKSNPDFPKAKKLFEGSRNPLWNRDEIFAYAKNA